MTRILLAFASLVLTLGAAAHARAFGKALAVLGAVHIAPGMSGSFKALWLADSTTLITVAAIFSLVALRPSATAGWLTMLVALIPAGTALFIYIFLGNFYAGHLLLAASAAAFIAGWRLA